MGGLGEVSPSAVLKVNPCALDWRPRPGFRARTVSRGANGVLEWTSKSVSSGSEARGTELWKGKDDEVCRNRRWSGASHGCNCG